MSNTPPLAFDARQSDVLEYGNMTGPLDTDGHTMAVAFDTTQVTSKANRSNPKPGDACHPLAAGAHPPAIAFDAYNQTSADTSHPLRCGSGSGKGDEIPQTFGAQSVRRLTPRECERLQGFPDDYTLIPYRGKQASDGPRYKALGNSMAVPVMRWIGERIARLTDSAGEQHGKP